MPPLRAPSCSRTQANMSDDGCAQASTCAASTQSGRDVQTNVCPIDASATPSTRFATTSRGCIAPSHHGGSLRPTRSARSRRAQRGSALPRRTTWGATTERSAIVQCVPDPPAVPSLILDTWYISRREEPMALSLKDPEADRLAREVAARTGETLTAAVVVALRERLARLRGRSPAGRHPTGSYAVRVTPRVTRRSGQPSPPVAPV